MLRLVNLSYEEFFNRLFYFYPPRNDRGAAVRYLSHILFVTSTMRCNWDLYNYFVWQIILIQFTDVK